MSLATSTTELKAKIMRQFGEQELKSRTAITIAEPDLGQLLLKHHLLLGSLSTTQSMDQNATLAGPFFGELFKHTVRISMKSLQDAALSIGWAGKH
eukprot:5847011-Amphidinium_carterae.1